jgi:hypothetical protein
VGLEGVKDEVKRSWLGVPLGLPRELLPEADALERVPESLTSSFFEEKERGLIFMGGVLSSREVETASDGQDRMHPGCQR